MLLLWIKVMRCIILAPFRMEDGGQGIAVGWKGREKTRRNSFDKDKLEVT